MQQDVVICSPLVVMTTIDVITVGFGQWREEIFDIVIFSRQKKDDSIVCQLSLFVIEEWLQPAVCWRSLRHSGH